MTIEHKNITDPDIHEPKGVATASTNYVYVADGAGSGNWEDMNPHGGIYYSAIGTGTTYTTPTAYTVINPLTVETALDNFSQASGKLTYDLAEDRHCFFVGSICFKHSTGSGQDVYFEVYKNGVAEASSETVKTADSANYQNITVLWDGVLSTSDYIEVYLKTASGSVVVHALQYKIIGVPH